VVAVVVLAVVLMMICPVAEEAKGLLHLAIIYL
jgi:hypothetical protein